MSTGSTLRIGLVGAGRFSQARVVPELAKASGVTFVSVANNSPDSTARVADRFEIPVQASSWQDVVSSPDVDLVFNGTQAPQHHDILLGALENGKHLFTMNPLAMTAAEGREIVAALEARPHLKARQYAAFPHGPYAREDALVLRLLSEGRIGRVLSVEVQWHTPYLAFGSYFDILNRWAGSHVRILAVRMQHEVGNRRVGFSAIVADLGEDRAIRYTHDNLMPRAIQNARIALHGEEGTLSVEAYPANPFSSVRITAGDAAEGAVVPVPDDLRGPYEEERHVNVEEQFVGWVMGGPEPTPLLLTLQQGLQSLNAAEAFVASMRQGGAWVDLPQNDTGGL